MAQNSDQILESVDPLEQPDPVMPQNQDPFTGLPTQALGYAPTTYEKDPTSVLSDKNAPVSEKLGAMETLKQRDLEQEALKERHAAQKFQSYQKYQADVASRVQLADDMKARGISGELPEMPDPADYNLTVTDVSLFSNPEIQQKVAPAVEQKQKDDQQAQKALRNEQEAALGARQADQQQNMLLGQIAQQEKLSADLKTAYDKAAKAVDDKQYQLEQVDPNRFWGNRSTGQQILGTVAIMLGELGRGTGKNTALEIINKYIDDDINSQKLNNEQKISMKQNALKRAQMEIDRIEAMSKDSARKFEMKQIATQLQQQQQALREQQIMRQAVNEKLFKGAGLTPEEASNFLTEEQRGRTVTLPSGNIVLTSNRDAAQKASPILDKNRSAREMLQEFKKSVANLSPADKLNYFSTNRAQVKSQLEALVGQLREPITGPGVLSEQEYARLSKDVLGDPTSLFTTPGLFEARIQGLEQMLKVSERATLKNAGVTLPVSKADRLRQILYKQGRSLDNVEKTINHLRNQDPSMGE